MHAVGCSAWTPSCDSLSHTWICVPSHVDEGCLIRLFESHAATVSEDGPGRAILGPCGYFVSPRIGNRVKVCRKWFYFIFLILAKITDSTCACP